MSYIQRFSIQGLAGRPEVVEAELDESVSALFGPNGNGKTSLLRILHSVLELDGELVKDVPFTKAEVTLFSHQHNCSVTYTLTKEMPEQTEKAKSPRETLLGQPDRVPQWQASTDPGFERWAHDYLPTSRLYADTAEVAHAERRYGVAQLSERDLEVRFAANLTQTWRNYCSDVARRTYYAQESGLASILDGVISKYQSAHTEPESDPEASFAAVNNFLRRRRMREISRDEFVNRYKEDQFRSVVKDIETVERRIDHIIQPREHFKGLVSTLFNNNKSLNFTDTELEVLTKDRKISLASLSSGEKHLLVLFIHTMLTYGAPILIDEPELSLHIDWQRRLVSDLRVLSPSTQILLATHSPEIVADLSEKELHRI